MKGLLLCLFLIISLQLFSQKQLKGIVYDNFNRHPVEGVMAQTTSGGQSLTDSLGRFILQLTPNDSVFFTYLGKSTQRFPVDTISDISNFEIAIYVNSNWLPEVRVQNRSYTSDSIQNRQEYAKIFNYKKPGIKLSSASPSTYVPGSVTVGIDLAELINMFRFRRNRQMQTFQDRLIREEEEKYINHRFTKFLVQKLTPLKGVSLDSFMIVARPPYEFLVNLNDLEFGFYIQEMYKLYKNGDMQVLGELKEEDFDIR